MIAVRWVHIASMATLLGGMIFWRLVMAPASVGLPEGERSALLERAASAFRPLIFAAVTGLLASGIINYLGSPGHTPFYHMLLGIKLLLAMHVFAVAILIVKPGNKRRTRLATGTMISGLIILLISAWLRRIF